MPLPTPLPQPGPGVWVFQCTIIFGYGSQGWSETHYLHCTGGATPLLAAQSRAGQLASRRKEVLPIAAAIDAVRVSDVSVRGDSHLGLRPLDGAGVGRVLGTPANPSLGWYATEADATGAIRDTRIFRGWVEDDISFNIASPRAAIPSANANRFLIDWAAEAVASRDIFGTTTRWGIRSYQRLAKDGPDVLTGVQVLVEGGRLVYVTPSAIPLGWEVGKIVNVLYPRVRCVRGVSGRQRITSIATVGGITTIKTDRRYDCDAEALNLATATIFLIADALYAIGRVSIGGQGKRDTGRRFFVPRGRASARA